MSEQKHDEGYVEAVREMAAAQDDQAVFDEDFERFKSLLFNKGQVQGGRWWVGSLTYQQAVEARVGRFPFAPGRNGGASG